MMSMRHMSPARAGLLVCSGLLFALAGCAGEGEGGEEGPAVQVAADADPQQLMTELQSIQAELESIRQRAMQSPDLQAERDSLAGQLETEMEELDPETAPMRERQQEIVTEAEAARAAGEEETVQELAAENREIQASLQETQQAVMETPTMSAAVDSFRLGMIAAMNEVDPRTDSLVARAQAIVAFLQERMAQQQGGRPGGAPPGATPDTM